MAVMLMQQRASRRALQGSHSACMSRFAAGSGSRGAAEAPIHHGACPCAEGTPASAEGARLRLSLQLAGVPVGSPIPLGPGGTFTGTFPAPAERRHVRGAHRLHAHRRERPGRELCHQPGGERRQRRHNTPDPDHWLRQWRQRSASHQSDNQSWPCSDLQGSSIYMCIEHNCLACTTLIPILPERFRYGVGVLLHVHFSSMKSWAVALQQCHQQYELHAQKTRLRRTVCA